MIKFNLSTSISWSTSFLNQRFKFLDSNQKSFDIFFWLEKFIIDFFQSEFPFGSQSPFDFDSESSFNFSSQSSLDFNSQGPF